MSEERICRNCRSYFKLREDDPAFEGECRRYPPSLDTGSPLERYNFSFPLVRDHTWCSEYVEADADELRERSRR